MFQNILKQPEETKYDRVHFVKSDPVSSRLDELIKKPPRDPFRMEVTPELATAMLDYNVKNRPKKNRKIEVYTDQMRKGKWEYTAVPVTFSESGVLLDGQNRLMAVEASGATITTAVAFGLRDSAFYYYDIGATRTASDIFSINGVKNSAAMAAITRAVCHYDDGRNSISAGYGMTHEELYERFLKLENITGSMPIFHKFHSSRLAAPSLMAALHYICARKNRKEADYFFSVASDGGASRRKNAPENILHKRLIQNATSGEKLKPDSIAGLTLTAWNLARRDLSGRGLSFSGGRLPAVL